MKVTGDHLRDVLDDAISTYVDVDTQINHDEIANIIAQFKYGASLLMEKAEDRVEEIEEEYEEDDNYDEDDVDD